MAVTYDSVGAGGVQTPIAAVSQSHTLASSGADTLMVAAVAIGRNQTPGIGSWTRTCTYDAVGMNSKDVQAAGSGTGGGIELWTMFNPPTGTKAAQADVPSGLSGSSGSIILATAAYKGVGSVSAATKNSSTSGSPTVTISSATNHQVVGLCCGGNSLSAPTQTQRYLLNNNTATAAGNMMLQDAPGAASVTLAATMTSDWWAAMAIDLVPVSGSSIRIWNGSAWVDPSTGPRIWNGSAWVASPDPGLL